MKKKKLSALAVTFFFLATGSLASCGKKKESSSLPSVLESVHQHDFSTAWAHDETKHWHACKDTSCNEKKDLADHSFVWSEKTPASLHTNKVEKGVCSVCNYATERTVENTATHEWSDEWKKDATGHWHETSCTDHDPMKKDFSEHQGEWTVKVEAAYKQNRVDERTCTVCAFHEEKTIEGTALAFKPRSITVSQSEFVYNAKPYALDSYITTEDKEGMQVEYRKKGTEAYSTSAPSNVGIYEYKVTLPKAGEWDAAEKTGEMKIAQYEVKLTKKEFSRDLGSQIVDGQIQLEEIEVNIDASTKEKIMLTLDASFDVAGVQSVPATELKLANPNYALNVGEITEVTLKNYDTADFYCGIQDIYTFPSKEGVAIQTQIARGTLKVGDSVYIHEIKKSVTVTAMEAERQKLEKATVGETVLFLVTGITKTEIARGYTVSKKDTLLEYDRVVGNIYVYTKDEGGRHTPLMDSTKEAYLPTIRFVDTNSEREARMFFPKDTTMIMPGETVEGVRFYFPYSMPAFVGRSFVLIESGRTIAKVEITDVHKHDSNYYRDGTCMGCYYSSGTSLTLTDHKAEVERKFLKDENRIFLLLLTGNGKGESTYRFTLSDTTNFTMALKGSLGNKTYTLNSKGDFTVEKNGYYHLAIHITAKNRGTCKLTVSEVFTIKPIG